MKTRYITITTTTTTTRNKVSTLQATAPRHLLRWQADLKLTESPNDRVQGRILSDFTTYTSIFIRIYIYMYTNIHTHIYILHIHTLCIIISILHYAFIKGTHCMYTTHHQQSLFFSKRPHIYTLCTQIHRTQKYINNL